MGAAHSRGIEVSRRVHQEFTRVAASGHLTFLVSVSGWQGRRSHSRISKGTSVKLSRPGIVAGLAAVSLLALTACGSDNNSGSTKPSATASDIACAKGSLTAAGSTAQLNAVAEWVKNYQSTCPGSTLNYQGVGSGAGIQQFTQGTVDFAGSDSALKPTEKTQADARCKTGKAIDLPMVPGPIAVVYHLPGVQSLTLRPTTLAKVFAGNVTRWDDAAIRADNPGVSLPATPIQAIHRADSSGTTDNFTKYLTAAGKSAWTYDHDKVWKAPGGTAAKGSDGIASVVKSTSGAISYVEYSFVQTAGLAAAKVVNGDGQAIEVGPASAAKAVAGAKVVGSAGDLSLSLDYRTSVSGAYPIILVTYEIVCQQGNDPGQLPAIKAFLAYTSSPDGQGILGRIGHAPLPDQLRSKVAAAIKGLS